MEKLISMTEFVLQENFKIHNTFFPECVIKYAQFLKQPLTLGMFVPCDEKGNVMDQYIIKPYDSSVCYDLDKFKIAKNKVLFEGFKIEKVDQEEFEDVEYVVRCGSCYVGIKYINVGKIRLNDICLKETIEDLVEYDLKLTHSALKQI